MESQKEPSLTPLFVAIAFLIVVTLLVVLYYRGIEKQKAHDRAVAQALARQRQAEEINRKERELIQNAPPFKLPRD